jgi:hypothetical protein
MGKANGPFENWTSLSGIQMPFEYRTTYLTLGNKSLYLSGNRSAE